MRVSARNTILCVTLTPHSVSSDPLQVTVCPLTPYSVSSDPLQCVP